MKAVSIGELAVDWLSLECGESMMTATKFYRYLGGNASNVAVGLSRLGLKSAILSKVGVDVHADYLLSRLAMENVDSSWVGRDPVQPTAQCYMVRQPDGSPDYYAWPSPNASKTLSADDVKEEFFADSWLWHLAAVSFLATPRRYAMMAAVEGAHRNRKIVSYDACFPLVESDSGRKAAWKAMQLADIVRFNLAEAAYWSNLPFGTEPAICARKLREDLRAAVIIITLAERGAWLFTEKESAFCPPFVVDSVGDVGPGDAFSAGLIYGLTTLGSSGQQRETLYSLSISEWTALCRYGSCAGAMVTRAHSATERFPTKDELNLAVGKTSLQT